MATATATTVSSTSSFPFLETVYDDDDSSYEEYVIEEVIEEEEIVDMADDEKKADVGDFNMILPHKSPTPREKGVDDSTDAPPPPPSTGYALSTGPTTKIAPAPVAPPPPPPVTVSPEKSVVPLTPSKQRAKAASSAGLSELSKQLRVLHAKNESQAQDISRLERQLRILADLQGISVSDLRKALEEACASEAFGELQNRVQKLKFELEAATLAKQVEYQRKDTTAPHIANLELRIGELEEVEERQTKEIHHLYEQLRQERAKSTRLESENDQLKKELEDMMNRHKQEHARAAKLEASFQDQIRSFQEDQTKKMQEQLQLARQRLEQQQQQQQEQQQSMQQPPIGLSSTTPTDRSSTALTVPNSSNSTSFGTISPEMAAEYERMVKYLKEKDDELRIAHARLNAEEIKWVQKLREVQEQARKAQMDLQEETAKLALTVKELEDADGQNGLRLAQYKARFAVQDERIDDLEQQLDSLYTAFTLLKEEFDSENQTRAAMLSNLNDADAEIARQANVLEKQKSQRNGFGLNSTPASKSSFARGVDDQTFNSVPRLISTPTTQATTPSRRTDFDTPSLGEPADTHRSTPTPAYASAQPYTPTTPERNSSTWQLLFPEEAEVGTGGQGSWLIHGPLIVESKGMLRKWKTKASKIYLRGDHYQWDIGSKQSWPLQFGISKVEFNPNYSLSFVVYLNPSDTMAPVIRAAASNERDYHRWMAVLTKVTSGEEYGAVSDSVSATPGTPQSGRRSFVHSSSGRAARSSMGNNVSSFESSSGGSSRSNQFGPRMEDQEAADLQRALELSKQQM
jgi:hypothetical protein